MTKPSKFYETRLLSQGSDWEVQFFDYFHRERLQAKTFKSPKSSRSA